MKLRQIIKRVLKEEFEKQEVLEIPSLKIFGKRDGVAWMRLQEFLKKRGNPPYSIGGDLDLAELPIESLGNLQSVGGYLNLVETPIESLGNLQSVGGDLNLDYTPIESLGNLQSVGGHLDSYNTPIKSLGNLKSVGGDLNLEETPIESLGNLQSVGGDLNLRQTQLYKTYTGKTIFFRVRTEKKIRQMVNVGGKIYL